MSRRPPRKLSPGRQPRRGRAARTTTAAPAATGDDIIFTPLGYEPGYAYPLLVWLPDTAAGPARGFDLGRTMQSLSLRNFVAVQPVATPEDRRAIGLDGVIWRAIDRVCRRASVSRRRIFLVGLGAGGSDAFRIGCRHPREFAGVVSLGGDFPLDEGLFAALPDVRRLPMLLCCGRAMVTRDPARSDRVLRLFHAAGAALSMRIYPDDAALVPAALADANRWIMDEVCGTPAAEHSLSVP